MTLTLGQLKQLQTRLFGIHFCQDDFYEKALGTIPGGIAYFNQEAGIHTASNITLGDGFDGVGGPTIGTYTLVGGTLTTDVLHAGRNEGLGPI